MVGAGRERSEAPSSSARGGRSSIPHAPLRRALLDSMATPPGPSSSTAVPSRGRGKKKRGGGARGRGRGGRVTLTAPSSPPPPAVSPEHVTARWTRLRRRLHGLRSTSLRSTGLRPTSLGSTGLRPTRVGPTRPRRSTRLDGVLGRVSLRSRVAMPMMAGSRVATLMMAGSRLILRRRGRRGGNVYQHGATRLPSVPATREQRWLIFPDGER